MNVPGREWDNPDVMLGVDDALRQILSAFSPLPPIDLPIEDALGLTLAEDIVASINVPPFDNSAMDGYAVRSADTGTSPVSLSVVGTVAAGSGARQQVGEGQAARIMTGAPMPDGADSVIRFEEVSSDPGDEGRIVIRRQVRVHENVRDAGEDVTAGEVALPGGRVIGPTALGLLAAINRLTVPVHWRPKVGLLSTGDEVVEPGRELRYGQVYDANAHMLHGAIRRVGGEPVRLGIAADSVDALRERLGSISELDMLITSGGVSVGDFDIVKDVLQAEGEMSIWQVRMKPGKPLAFGHIGDVPLLGLPGNPVAALVSFDQFARPAILTMLGRTDVSIPTIQARLTEPVENRGQRRHFVRGTVLRGPDEATFTPSPVHGSAMLRAATDANGYAVVPEDCSGLDAGEIVLVQLPDEGLQGV